MKTTIELDDALYRQLKAHAALHGTSVKALVADAIKRLLKRPSDTAPVQIVRETAPAWVGSLSAYASNAQGEHRLDTMRESIAKGRIQK